MRYFNPPQRLMELDMVLCYDSEERKILRAGERIMICQERANLIGEATEQDVCRHTRIRDFKQNEMLEDKIVRILAIIKRTGFEPEHGVIYVGTYKEKEII